MIGGDASGIGESAAVVEVILGDDVVSGVGPGFVDIELAVSVGVTGDVGGTTSKGVINDDIAEINVAGVSNGDGVFNGFTSGVNDGVVGVGEKLVDRQRRVLLNSLITKINIRLCWIGRGNDNPLRI